MILAGILVGVTVIDIWT